MLDMKRSGNVPRVELIRKNHKYKGNWMSNFCIILTLNFNFVLYIFSLESP